MVALIVMITVMIMIMRKCTVSLITFYSKSNLNYLQLLTVGWAAHHQTLCGWNRTSENKDGMLALFCFCYFLAVNCRFDFFEYILSRVAKTCRPCRPVGANFGEKHAKNCAIMSIAHITYTIAHSANSTVTVPLAMHWCL